MRIGRRRPTSTLETNSHYFCHPGEGSLKRPALSWDEISPPIVRFGCTWHGHAKATENAKAPAPSDLPGGAGTGGGVFESGRRRKSRPRQAQRCSPATAAEGNARWQSLTVSCSGGIAPVPGRQAASLSGCRYRSGSRFRAGPPRDMAKNGLCEASVDTDVLPGHITR